jgi:hypothetical protein
VVVRTTHAQLTKNVAKKGKQTLVAQIFSEGLYFLTICAHGFLWLHV